VILYNSEMATQVALDAIQILGKITLCLHVLLLLLLLPEALFVMRDEVTTFGDEYTV